MLQKNLKIEQTDSIWKSKKNALSLSLLELYRGGIGVRYERFIKIKQSIGLHFTYYLFGWGYDTYSSGVFGLDKLPASHFTGFKMAPFYRYYFFRNNRKGLYFEVKMLTGYFDFSELFYVDYDDGEYFSENFWSFGGGVSVGHSLEFKNSMAVINLSVGLQYFPMNVPETMNYGNLEVSNDWWKILGPGAIFELKLTIGGIF